MLDQNELDWYAARLSIAVYDTRNETPEMALWEYQQAFPGLKTISNTPNGSQIFHFEDRDLEVGPMASNSEIALALKNPFVRTENTRLTVTSMSALKEKLLIAKGIVPKAASAIEAEADALIAQGAELATATTEAFAPHKEALGEAKTSLGDLKDALTIMSNQ